MPTYTIKNDAITTSTNNDSKTQIPIKHLEAPRYIGICSQHGIKSREEMNEQGSSNNTRASQKYHTEWKEANPRTAHAVESSQIRKIGAPGWLRRLSVRLPLRSRSHSSWVCVPCRALGWQLRAWSLLRILCLPLSLSFPRSCSVSLSLSQKINIKKNV